MATLDSKHVTWEGLEYYDSKIKNYVEQQIQEAAIDIKHDVVTSDTLDTRVNELKDHIDENEAAILVLQHDDKRIDARIDELSNNIVDNTSDIENMEANLASLQSSVSDDHKRVDKLSLDLTEKANAEHQHVLADIRDYEPVDLTDYVLNEDLSKTNAHIQRIEERVSTIETFFDGSQTPDDYIDTLAEIQRYIEDDAADAAKLLSDVSKLNDKVENIKVPTKISELENDATFVTSKELQDAIDAIEPPEVTLDGYATEEWVNTQGFIKDIPVEYVTEDELNNKGYLTEHQSLADYAKLSDIPTDYLVSADIETKADKSELEVLATKTELEAVQQIAGSNSALIRDLESSLVDIEAALETIPSIEGLATETYVDEKFAEIVVPDVSGYATEQWVKDELAKIDPSIPSEYITETELLEKGYITNAALTDYAKAESIPTKTSQLTNDSNFLTEHQDISGKADKSDLEGLATEQFVTDAISNIKHPDPDLSNYYTKGETNSAIAEAVDGIDIPEVDLEPYATKALVAEQVATKANSVPFAADMFVTDAQGGFVVGDNLNGMSIESILIKLLGLQTTITPDTPDTIVDMIIQQQKPMYQINEFSEVVEIPYSYVTFDNTTYDEAPLNDCFYQKLDENGNIVESGYQHVSEENDSMYYVIALPQGVNFNENVSVKVWDETSNTWADVTDNLEMSCDEAFIDGAFAEAEIQKPDVVEGYTLWIDASLNTCTGSDFRFIIN